MPQTVNRKILCYNINNGNNSVENLLLNYKEKLNNNWINLEARNLLIKKNEDSQLFLEIRSIVSYSDSTNENIKVYNLILYKLRNNNFPFIFNKLSGDKRKITTENADSLMDLTHIIIIPKINLALCERNSLGPEMHDLQHFLTGVLKEKANNLEITPIYTASVIDEMRNLKDIKSVTFKAGHQGIHHLIDEGLKIGLFDTTDGTFNPNTELEFEITIKGKGRNKPIDNKKNNYLMQSLQNIAKKIKKSKDAKENLDISKAKVFTTESKFPVDLLEEFMLAEVTVPKMDDKHKYVDSTALFSSIFDLYNNNSFKLDKYLHLTNPSVQFESKPEISENDTKSDDDNILPFSS